MSLKTEGFVLALKTRISSRTSVGRLKTGGSGRSETIPGARILRGVIYPPHPSKVALLIEDILDYGVGFLLYRQIYREFALEDLPKKLTNSVDGMPPCPRNGISMRRRCERSRNDLVDQWRKEKT